MDDVCVKDGMELWHELVAEESRRRLKRRWLMNAPLSNTDERKIKKLNTLSDESIPESLFRKDDAYYDIIKNFVKGVSGEEHEHASCLKKLIKNFVKGFSGEEHRHASCLKKLSKDCMSESGVKASLNGMTDEELCYLFGLVTDGSVNIERTEKTMKRIIKKHFASYLHSDLDKRNDQLSSLPENPQYLSGIPEDLCSSSESFLDSAIRVLDMLEEVPIQALAAMHRKLKGKTGLIIPMSLVDKKARRKVAFVSPLRIHCMKMLSEVDEGNPPPEALVEALSVAGVTLKLLCGHTHIIEFKRFSPKVKDLQNRIVKAIHTVTVVNICLLEAISKKLDLLSEGNVELLKKCPRLALRNQLIELLVECSDMESIPKGFVETLDDINNMAYFHIRKNLVERSNIPKKLVERSEDKVEEEVEFLLCFSAQIKQVLLDLLPEDEDVDQYFANAYMEEEAEDNDEEEDYTNESDSSECGSVTESMGETKSNQSSVSTPKQEPLDSFRSNGLSSSSHRNQSFSCDRLSSTNFEDQKSEAEPDDSELKTNLKDKGHHMQGQFSNLQQQQQQQQQCTAKNKYLSMQRACDETAMAMQRAIDGLLNELVKS